ncbi:UNVERIFIED_CONTAM: hypothetical protein RMT77_017112 [Armadillidium vulgare]
MTFFVTCPNDSLGQFLSVSKNVKVTKKIGCVQIIITVGGRGDKLVCFVSHFIAINFKNGRCPNKKVSVKIKKENQTKKTEEFLLHEEISETKLMRVFNRFTMNGIVAKRCKLKVDYYHSN